MATLSIALGEYDTGWHAPDASLRAAETVIARAASGGARLVVLPEMATTGFTMDTTQAVERESGDIRRLCALASEHGVWLIAGVAMRECTSAGESRTVNTALAIDPAGTIVATHRKQRLFAFAGEHEHYAPGGDATCLTIDGVRVALFVCYELRFPELFGAVAAETDVMIVIANWPATRRPHWDTLLRARAIENQCVVVGVNRVGVAGGLTYDGGSQAFDAWGERLAPAPAGVPLVTVDAAAVAEVRARFPFLRDRYA